MLHDKHRQWIDARGIDPALAEKFGISTTKDGDGFWLTVPYLERGETVNHKYRLTSEKRHRMDAGAPLLLWNADCLNHPEVLAGAPVVITEGEWDALAAMTAGLKHVVSVPNGAPANVTDKPEEAKRYDWVWRHLEALNKVKTFILATDGDDAGRNLQKDLIALLGADRCRFVTYPDATKDLNEVALVLRASRRGRAGHGAKPCPVKGLFKFGDFPPRGELQHWSTGLKMLDVYPHGARHAHRVHRIRQHRQIDGAFRHHGGADRKPYPGVHRLVRNRYRHSAGQPQARDPALQHGDMKRRIPACAKWMR
jgi:twinkle protein